MDQLSDPLLSIALSGLLAGILVRLAWIDLKTLALPDRYTLPLIGLGLGLSVFLPQPTFSARLIGAVAGFLILGLIGEVYFRRTGSEGLGLGDAKLFAAAGAWLGWQALPMVLLVASLCGLVYVTMLRRAERNLPVAFGPMLALGFFLSWVQQSFFAESWPFPRF